MGELQHLEQNRDARGDLPHEQSDAGEVGPDVDRPRGIVPLLHGGYHRGGEGPEHDEAGPGVQVRPREELARARVRVQRSLMGFGATGKK